MKKKCARKKFILTVSLCVCLPHFNYYNLFVRYLDNTYRSLVIENFNILPNTFQSNVHRNNASANAHINLCTTF